MTKTPHWTRGHIKFRDELSRFESLRQLGDAVGIDIAAASRIFRGLAAPGRKRASSVERATRGRVKVSDWDVETEAPK